MPGADAAAPELVGTAANGDLITVAASGVTIDGFLLNAQVAGGALNDSDNGITGSGSNITLHNNAFTGFDADGIAMTSSDNLDVHHNLFTGIGLDAIGVTGGTDVTITHNLVHGSGATVGAGRDGISVASSPGVVIDSNLIEGVSGGTGAVHDGVLLQSSDNAIVTNNTVSTDGSAGSVGAGHLAFEILTSANVTFTNNIGPASSHSVTASAGADGSLDVTTPSPATVNSGSTASFKFNANTNHHVAGVTSTCGPTTYTNTSNAVTSYTYTTDAVTADCSVSATFAINQYNVTASAGANGSLDGTTPSPATVNSGSTASFKFNANTGYHVAGVTSTCGPTTYTNTSNAVNSYTYTTDAVTATCSVSATFGYNFSGFFSPVLNPGPGPNFVFNPVNAGKAVSVKFSLSGNRGLNIFAAGYPKSEKVNCNSAGPLDDIQQTVTSGGSVLSYNATTDQYTYPWKSNTTWAGTCRRLIVRLNDGTDHVAYFKFTK